MKIGNHNVFREYATVHCATAEDLLTEMGDHNVILAYSHIAHECKVGNHLVMSSHAALGGHVEVGHHVNVGWGVGIHQFCRLGDHCMAAATATVLQDIPPFLPLQVTLLKLEVSIKSGYKELDFQKRLSAESAKPINNFIKKD